MKLNYNGIIRFTMNGDDGGNIRAGELKEQVGSIKFETWLDLHLFNVFMIDFSYNHVDVFAGADQECTWGHYCL